MKTCKMIRVLVIIFVGVLLPVISQAQGIGDKLYSYNSVLDKLFEEMLPKCDRLIDVGRALAGLGALCYISIRVWKHIARAEPVDFFPLLRPFAIGLAILLYTDTIKLLNSVLEPSQLQPGQWREIARRPLCGI